MLGFPRDLACKRRPAWQFALHRGDGATDLPYLLAKIQTTREQCQTNRTMRYPYKDKHFYPLL
jgi:hypothetical protein